MCAAVLNDVHRTITALLPCNLRNSGERPRLLDVGCWDGSATLEYARRIEAEPYGIEIFDQSARKAQDCGISVARLDLERESFPWNPDSFDLGFFLQDSNQTSVDHFNATSFGAPPHPTAMFTPSEERMIAHTPVLVL